MISRSINSTQTTQKLVFVVFLLLLLVPLYVNAAPETTSETTSETASETADVKLKGFAGSSAMSGAGSDPLNAGRMAQLVVGLFIVLLCIVALAWVAKRFNRLQSSSDGSLRVLGGLSMGSRERVVLVQVGKRQLLLGVAPGRINTLHVLDEPVESITEVSAQSADKSFAEKLSAAVSRNNKQ